jgi:hypothetical protein
MGLGAKGNTRYYDDNPNFERLFRIIGMSPRLLTKVNRQRYYSSDKVVSPPGKLSNKNKLQTPALEAKPKESELLEGRHQKRKREKLKPHL